MKYVLIADLFHPILHSGKQFATHIIQVELFYQLTLLILIAQLTLMNLTTIIDILWHFKLCPLLYVKKNPGADKNKLIKQKKIIFLILVVLITQNK